MELFFLGTSAGVPTRTRNVTSILLDLQHTTRGGLWMFDCGEGTQHQLLRTAAHPGKLDKIFITHLHGNAFWPAGAALQPLDGGQYPAANHLRRARYPGVC